jgi:hypothetical protein
MSILMDAPSIQGRKGKRRTVFRYLDGEEEDISRGSLSSPRANRTSRFGGSKGSKARDAYPTNTIYSVTTLRLSVFRPLFLNRLA